GTIIENISMFDVNKYNASLEAASLLGLDEIIADLPLGYETIVGGQAISSLPHGLIQRICVARALVIRPRILLFDRVSSSVDQETENLIWSVLRGLKGKCTIVMVTNMKNLFDLADKCYELKNACLTQIFI
ncbi:MAG: hypothetical protein HQK79_19700, partial [Desulfobacterales bacterium]|nr:hypothetical protein [Desulfobacterales bacterium]